MNIIKVVCGIIWQDDKFFIARRKPEKSMGGYWEFPGGKIEADESPQEALERELREELEMLVDVKEYFFTNVHHYEKISVELISYQATFISSSFLLVDHDAYEWIQINDALNYKFAPADIPILNELLLKLK
jgi:8-oxo-dGTP diphosphatase